MHAIMHGGGTIAPAHYHAAHALRRYYYYDARARTTYLCRQRYDDAMCL